MQHNQNNNLSTQEKRRVCSLSNLISDVERRAAKLKTALAKAKADLDGCAINTLIIVNESEDYFRAYRNEFLHTDERRRILEAFTRDMAPMVAEILKEAAPYKAEIADINRIAEDRGRTLRMLEEAA